MLTRAAGRHVQGLQQGSSLLPGLSNRRLRRQLRTLEDAYAFARHTNEEKIGELLREFGAALAVREAESHFIGTPEESAEEWPSTDSSVGFPVPYTGLQHPGVAHPQLLLAPLLEKSVDAKAINEHADTLPSYDGHLPAMSAIKFESSVGGTAPYGIVGESLGTAPTAYPGGEAQQEEKELSRGRPISIDSS